MSSASVAEVVRVRRLLGRHVMEVVSLIPASPEDTAALTQEVVRAITAGVGLVSGDADAMGRRVAKRMTGVSSG
jgi:hypothetical protein